MSTTTTVHRPANRRAWWLEIAKLYRWKIGLTLLAGLLVNGFTIVKVANVAAIASHDLDCEAVARADQVKKGMFIIIENRPLFIKLGLSDEALAFADAYEQEKRERINELIEPVEVSGCPASTD